jgi:hypothetical protein
LVRLNAVALTDMPLTVNVRTLPAAPVVALLPVKLKVPGTQVGAAIVTVLLHMPGQPLSMMLSVTVNEPDAPAVTVTEDPVVGPTIEPLPLIDQLCVAPAGAVEVYTLPIELGHTGIGPSMLQVGLGLTVTVLLHMPGQPLSMMLSVTVNEPAAPAVTVTDEPVVGPTIEPLPLIDQLCVAPAGAVEVYVLPIEPAHTGIGPSMLQLGLAFTVTVLLHMPAQPLSMMLSVTVNEPAEPAVTVTDEPVVGPTIEPSPLIDQLCVAPAVAVEV